MPPSSSFEEMQFFNLSDEDTAVDLFKAVARKVVNVGFDLLYLCHFLVYVLSFVQLRTQPFAL